MTGPLTGEQIDEFRDRGYLIIEGFYDEHDLMPIWRGIHEVIGLVAARAGLELDRAPFEAVRFDDGYDVLFRHDRALGGLVYDAVKQLAPFVRLVASTRHEEVYAQLRGGVLPGVAAGGFGIRIDNPGEDFYGAPWHQEYPGQFRSLDGCVFWAPLRTVTPELGPVELCLGSHLAGALPIVMEADIEVQKAGAYPVRILDEATIVGRFERSAPLSRAGDLVVVDFLTIHRSGVNRSGVSRWSMQSRLFNFRDPTGVRIGWSGSFAAGRRVSEVEPSLDVTRAGDG